MRFRQVGRSGLTVSVLGLGCNNFGGRLDQAGTTAVVSAALDVGITLFDTADSYGESESLLGNALVGHRDGIVLATKFGSQTNGRVAPHHEARGSRRYIRRAVEASLTRLKTDWIDLLQLHRPDPLTPIEETLDALTELIDDGLVRYIGSSNLAAWQVVEAEFVARERGGARFISAQNDYSIVQRDVERELVPAALKYGIGVIPFFPLRQGLLTGKYARGVEPQTGRFTNPMMKHWLNDAAFDQVDALQAFAAERDLSLVDVAMGGLAAEPGVVSVIAGASNREQVEANLAAIDWIPTEDDLAQLRALSAD